MGKDKDYITVDITIEQAVKAIVRSFGDSEDTVIIAMANHMLVTGFDMSYENCIKITPGQESVHVECKMSCDAVIRHLLEVAENGWEGVNVDSEYCKLITKTKIAKTKEGTKKYTGEPIPFREFKARIARFEELREKNNMPIPEYWVDDNSEVAQDRIDDTDWGTDWGDISITIETSGNLFLKRISAAVGQREHASKLGLVDVRNNDPTAECKVMMKLANGLSVKTNTANKKYISKIRKSLKLFFKIEHNPFHEYDSTYGYRPKFTLKETITSQDGKASRMATHTTYVDGVQTEQGFEELTETERAAEVARLEQEQIDDDNS